MDPMHLLAGLAAVVLGVAILVTRATIDFKRGKNGRAALQVGGALVGTSFALLTFATTRLPVLRGSQWSLRDTVIRAGAIACGVAFVLAVLTALLPWWLDRLERGHFVSFVGARHIRSQKSGFLTVISILSIAGVAVSSCALSSVVSVMGGFSQDLKRKIVGNNAHVVIDMTDQGGWGDYEELLSRLRAAPGVAGATPVVHGELMISSASNLSGVVVRGIDSESIGKVIDLPRNVEVGHFEYLENPEKLKRIPRDEIIGLGVGGESFTRGDDMVPTLPDDIDPAIHAALDNVGPTLPALVLGRELAKTLHVYVGDEISLVSPLGDLGPMGVMPKTRKFRIGAIFYSGMYEYDANQIYMRLSEAQDYFGMPGQITAIDVKVADAENVDQFVPAISSALHRGDLRVRDWREINKNLFSALKLERAASFPILSIAILVASFCIICTLLLMVTEKAKEIAILKAIGASDRSILQMFMTEGVIIGAVGTMFGVATGLAVCAGLSWFGLRLDPDVYYIDRLPISVTVSDFVAVALSAMTICTLATVWPAIEASRLRPVEGLRYE